MLRRLDIQGYDDKSEVPEKWLSWTDVGLKAAFTIQLLNKSRQGLRYILDVKRTCTRFSHWMISCRGFSSRSRAC